MGSCSVDGCLKSATSRGMCPMHYQRVKTTGCAGPSGLLPKRQPEHIGCSVECCSNGHSSHGMCAKHYAAAKRRGQFSDARCLASWCDCPAFTNGLCSKHALYVSRHPSVVELVRCEWRQCESVAIGGSYCELHKSVARRDADDAVKTCASCDVTKPSTEFYIARRSLDGLSFECKECDSSRGKRLRKEIASAPKATPESQTCQSCKLLKLASDFYASKFSRSGLTPNCKNCCSNRNKNSYRRHSEKRKASVRAYVAANLQRVRIWRKDYYSKNSKKIAARASRWFKENPVQRRITSARWRAENRHLLRDIARARRKSAGSRFTKKELLQRLEVFGNRCAYCGRDWEHLDHVKPLALGGPHCLSNIRPACAQCNLKKGAKPYSIWFDMIGRQCRL